jgi:hypothetical protein
VHFLQQVVVYISDLAGVMVALIAISNLRRARQAYLLAMNVGKERVFETAIKSDDLTTLGNYFYREVGSVSLSEYASDERVQERIGVALERLRDFLGEPETAIPSEPSAKAEVELVHSEFQDAKTQIRAGKTWNGLARLRRGIEMRLRGIARAHGIPYEKRGVPHLLAALAGLNLLPSGVKEHLEYATRTANRGIHGLEVSAEEAEKALMHADIGISLLEGGPQNQGSL